jgi:hypothetical protein
MRVYTFCPIGPDRSQVGNYPKSRDDVEMDLSEGNAPPGTLAALCALLDADSILRDKVKAAQNPKEVVDIASSVGLEISPAELRVWSRELSASYFPWGGHGHEYRRNFFKGYL